MSDESTYTYSSYTSTNILQSSVRANYKYILESLVSSTYLFLESVIILERKVYFREAVALTLVLEGCWRLHTPIK